MNKKIPDSADIPPHIEYRFFAKIDNKQPNPDACHLWKAACNNSGRGIFQIRESDIDYTTEDKSYRVLRADRLAWSFHHGTYNPAYGRMRLSSYCTTKTCVNPLHFRDRDFGAPRGIQRHHDLTDHGLRVLVSAVSYGIPHEEIESAFQFDTGISPQFRHSSIGQLSTCGIRAGIPSYSFSRPYTERALQAYRDNVMQPVITPEDLVPTVTIDDCF
jgi:hypothetical protein